MGIERCRAGDGSTGVAKAALPGAREALRAAPAGVQTRRRRSFPFTKGLAVGGLLSAPADAIQVAAEPGTDDIQLFREPAQRPKSRGQAFLISALGHCAFFFLLPRLGSFS